MGGDDEGQRRANLLAVAHEARRNEGRLSLGAAALAVALRTVPTPRR